MMSRKKYLWLTAPLILLFALIIMPARPVLHWFGDSAGLSASGVSGSVWNGQAASLMLQGNSFSQVKWQLNPLYLFTGQLALKLKVDDPLLQFDGEVQMSANQTLHLQQAKIEMPMERIKPFLPMKNMVVDGRLTAHINQLSFAKDTGPQNVDATLFWQEAKASISGPQIALGDFQIRAMSEGENQLKMTLMKSQNQLDAQGSALLTWPSQLELDIDVKNEVPETLQSTVAFLKLNENNRRVLQLKLPLKFN